MSPRLRTASWTAALSLVLGAPATAAADEATVGLRLLLQPGDPGGAAPGATPAPAAPVTVIDWSAARTITLPELLQLAVRQAPALQRAVLDIEVAEARIEALRSIDDWLISASMVGSTSGSNAGQIGSLQAAFDVVRALPTGGSVALHAESGWNQRVGTETIDSNNDGIPDGFSFFRFDEFSDLVTLTVAHELLEGRGREYFRAQQRQAGIARDVAAVQREAQAMTTTQQVVAAYWNLVYARRDLEIRRSSLELARERLRITQASIRGGGVAATEALAVEQVIATREEEVLAAEIALIERSIDVRRLVGMDIGPGQLGLTTDATLGIPTQDFALDALLAEAYERNPDLERLALAGENATISVEVAENALLPSLQASLTVGPAGVASEREGVSSARAALDAFTNMVTFDQYAVFGRLTFEHTLGNYGAKGQAREARAARVRLEVDAFDVRAAIAEVLSQAVVLTESAERRVAIAARAIELAEQNIKAEQARFGLGKATNFDVLTRQEELKQAQLRQARAIVDWHLAATTIAAVTGRILTDYGISLPE